MGKRNRTNPTPDAAVQQETPVAAVQQTEPTPTPKRAPREVRNGVPVPREGGLCRAVWDHCAAVQHETGNPPTAAQVRAHAQQVGWNLNNASIEYYQWRKSEGIRGRVRAAAPETAATPEGGSADAQ